MLTALESSTSDGAARLTYERSPTSLSEAVAFICDTNFSTTARVLELFDIILFQG